MSKVTVKPIRHFRDHESGEMVGPGDSVEVSRTRAIELRQNGLIEDFEVKQEPDNKQAPEPSNKAAGKSMKKGSSTSDPEPNPEPEPTQEPVPTSSSEPEQA